MGKFTGNADQLPTGITVEAVESLIEAGTSEKRAYAVAWRDNGGTNQLGGESMGAVFGVPVKSGGFGNLVTAGLRDIGRDSEVTAHQGGGGVKITGFAEYVAQYRTGLQAKRAKLVTMATEAAAAVENVDTDAVIQAELDRLRVEVEAINARADAINADPTAYVDAHTERLRAAADAAATARDEGLALIDTELVEAGMPPLDAPEPGTHDIYPADAPELATPKAKARAKA